MKSIDQETYRQLVSSATVLERDAHGEKVLALADGNLVKIFRRKRWLSSALLRPYAVRFVGNAAHLARRAIPTVTVLEIGSCRSLGRHLVTYRPLPGETLRHVLSREPAERARLLRLLAAFVALLHQKGVYFRSVHFANIIVLPDREQLGLIDVADLSLRRGPLSRGERLRNFRHLLRYAEDGGYLHEFGWMTFVASYLDAVSLPPVTREELRVGLQKLAELTPAVAQSREES